MTSQVRHSPPPQPLPRPLFRKSFARRRLPTSSWPTILGASSGRLALNLSGLWREWSQCLPVRLTTAWASRHSASSGPPDKRASGRTTTTAIKSCLRFRWRRLDGPSTHDFPPERRRLAGVVWRNGRQHHLRSSEQRGRDWSTWNQSHATAARENGARGSRSLQLVARHVAVKTITCHLRMPMGMGRTKKAAGAGTSSPFAEGSKQPRRCSPLACLSWPRARLPAVSVKARRRFPSSSGSRLAIVARRKEGSWPWPVAIRAIRSPVGAASLRRAKKRKWTASWRGTISLLLLEQRALGLPKSPTCTRGQARTLEGCERARAITIKEEDEDGPRVTKRRRTLLDCATAANHLGLTDDDALAPPRQSRSA